MEKYTKRSAFRSLALSTIFISSSQASVLWDTSNPGIVTMNWNETFTIYDDNPLFGESYLFLVYENTFNSSPGDAYLSDITELNQTGSVNGAAASPLINHPFWQYRGGPELDYDQTDTLIGLKNPYTLGLSNGDTFTWTGSMKFTVNGTTLIAAENAPVTAYLANNAGRVGTNTTLTTPITPNVISQEVYAGFTDYGVETIKSYTKAALSMPGYSKDGSARSVRIPVGTSSEPVVSGVSSESVTSVFAGYTHYNTGTDSSINGADYDIRSNGGIVGVRHEVGGLMLGGFLGVDEGEVNSSTLNSDSEALLLGAIASYTIKPEMNLIVTGGITYGSYEFSGTRAPAAFDDVGSDVFDIHVGLEGDAYAANNIRVTPFVGFHYIYSDTEAFNETGPGALSVDAHDYDAFFSEIGVEAEYQLTKQVSLNGNLSYTHNLSGSDKNIGASLGGTPFAVASPGLGNDFFTIGIGAQYQVTEDVRLGINYRAEFSTDAEVANGVNIGGSYSF